MNAATTVVVATRNSEATLDDCLRSIRDQTSPNVELVVVDNHSEDATPTIARAYADTFITAGPERSAQRNLGAAAGTGDYLLFIDADMVLDPEVVEQCIAASGAGHELVVIPESTLGTGFLAACKALERSCYVGDETIEAARFFSRDLFFRHGGYDEQLTGPEDWDLPARMRADGAQVGRVTATIAHVEGRLRLVELLRSKYYYGKTFPRYIRKHPQLAAEQMHLFRPAFLRNTRRLARNPGLVAGMILMKGFEICAGAIGFCVGRVNEARRRT